MTTADALNIVLSICAVPLAGLISAALLKLRAKLGKQDTAQDQANLEAQVQASIGAGMQIVAQTAPQILRDGITTPEGMNDVASAAASYFRQMFPDRTATIAKARGLGDRTNDIHAAVAQTIGARLTNVNPAGVLITAPGPVLDGAATSAATTLAAPLP